MAYKDGKWQYIDEPDYFEETDIMTVVYDDRNMQLDRTKMRSILKKLKVPAEMSVDVYISKNDKNKDLLFCKVIKEDKEIASRVLNKKTLEPESQIIYYTK